MKSTHLNFWDVNWGPDEAKDDLGLRDYFFEIPQYQQLLDSDKRFVIGRKGTGKTAVLQRIKFEAESDPFMFVKELTLREFPISDLKSFADKSMQDKSKYVNIWKFLILVEIAKLIIQDNSITDIDRYVELRSFISDNFPDKFGGFVDTVQKLKIRKNKVSILSDILGGEAAREKSSSYTIEVHYSKVVEFLTRSIELIQSESRYFCLFDELDEGYKSKDQNKRLLLLSLFRAIENLALRFKNCGVRFRPILALRSDIFDRLEDNDLNKYDDYIVRLEWRGGDEQTRLSLMGLVKKRIDTSLSPDISGSGGKSSWNKVVVDKDDRIPGKKKSVWTFIRNRTFERPRDVLKYLKYCSDLNKDGN